MSIVKFTTADGTTFVAEDDTSLRGCEGCAFHNKQAAGLICSLAPSCIADDRADNRTVIWIEQK